MTGPVVHPLTVELAGLADNTRDHVLDLLRLALSGDLDLDQLPELAAVIGRLGVEQSAELVLAEFHTELAAQLSRIVGPEAAAAMVAESSPFTLATLPDSTYSDAAMAGAVRTVLDGPAELYAGRLGQLTRSAVARAGQDVREQAVRSSPLTEGWTRGIDSDSCELCVWWWRGGRSWPKSHHMPRHKGCTCVQVPVLAEVSGVSRQAWDESAERIELERRGEYLDAFGTDRRHNKQRTGGA